MGGVWDDPVTGCGGKARSCMDTALALALCAKDPKSVDGEFCVEKAGDEYDGEAQAEVGAGGDDEKDNEWDCDDGAGVRGVARKCCGGRASVCSPC